jgi:CheY-like chemotaxis protein
MLFDAVADAKSGQAGVNAPALGRPASDRLRGLRLLVVEDNLMNQQVAYELLTHEGAQVSVASNGRLGVEAAVSARPRFDAVLMDIQMPDIDGCEATVQIRRHASLQSMPVIAMTANAMADDRATCLAAGMDDHIGKPIDLDLLVTTILRHCRPLGSGAADGVGRGTAPTPLPAPALPHPPMSGDSDQAFEEALRRVGGNRVLFADMAKLFLRSSITLAADLQRYILRQDKAGAANLLHTLRGTAGTVGATDLVSYAVRLEQQLRQPGDVQTAAFSMHEFDSLVRHVCNELRIFAEQLNCDSPSGIMARAVLDRPRLAALLDQLDALMREKNMQATLVFDELRSSCGMALGDKLTLLEEAMNDLNFPLSLQRTQRLRESLQ